MNNNNVKLREKNKIRDRLTHASRSSREGLLVKYNSSEDGLLEERVAKNRLLYGDNKISKGKEITAFDRFKSAFLNPFTIILIVLTIISYFTDVILVAAEDRSYMTVIIISSMVIISGLLQMFQERRSQDAADKLSKMVENTSLVKRKSSKAREIAMEELVVGDIVYLSAGDMIPADMRVLNAKDLFISQSSLTGESQPVEKFPKLMDDKVEGETLTEYDNLVFMGTTVVSGSAKCIVIASGEDSILGGISDTISEDEVKTSFEKGVDSVSILLIRFMLVMVPIVFLINGLSKKDWFEALLFSISIAVGLTPEMLPMIVTTSLAKGAISMSEEKTIVKSLHSIQNLGSMDVLCTDKTGTLTEDRVVLEYHLNIHGESDPMVLEYAFLNSYYQTGLKNLMDLCIIEKGEEELGDVTSPNNISSSYKKLDEVPFDFERRRMSVVVKKEDQATKMITKGAVEEILTICSKAKSKGRIVDLDEELISDIEKKVRGLNQKGMRVIALAKKINPSPIGEFSIKDEDDMILLGYLAFLDPPKKSAAEAISSLQEYGVVTKVLTGDNEVVTASVCDKVGIESDKIILGSDIEKLDDSELANLVEEVNIFAKLSPDQKSRIVKCLRENGHTVGFLGDGINDAPAMKDSDIGISVNNAVDIAKESAQVILLEKDLNVLEKGIIEGRKTYANMIKYIKMTASSNFGNVFSVLLASAFLPFLPMEPIHLLLLNLIYDISCLAIPWDNVDEDYLMLPREWDASSIRDFMLIIGPTSSVFDITTYLLMFFIIAPQVVGMNYSAISDPAIRAEFIAVFQSGWFVESMWSQTLVIHMLRTKKIPFIESRASAPLTILTFTAIGFLTWIPFTSFGTSLGLTSLPLNFFGWLALTLVLYMILAGIAKKIFVNKYGELL